MENKAIFMDRDGTLNEMVYDEENGILDSPRKSSDVLLRPYVAEFIEGARVLNYQIIIISNQPGIAKGTMTFRQLQEVNERISLLIKEKGTEPWDALFYSPYHPDGGPWARTEYVKDSDCRKPSPGMLLKAAQQHRINLSKSWMIGDGLTDIQAGQAAGCRTILLTKLKIEMIEKFIDLETEPDFVSIDLKQALSIVQMTTLDDIA